MLALRFGCMFCVATMMLAAGLTYGQAYPTKAIRVITSGIGGGGDFTARIVVNGISPALGQQVIVENRASGGQTADIASKALPDGYTVLITGQSFWIGPLMQKTIYDPVQDFSPVT